jgi:cytidylate kinase
VSVVTVFRQAGCKGRYIAENLAQAMGYNLADYTTAERLMLQCGYAKTAEVYQSVPDFWDRFTRRGLERDEINSMLRSVTRAMAHHGNVVMLGRGCYAALQDMSDVLNVRLKAPYPLRVERVMEEQRMTEGEAAAFIEEKDTLVADFARTSYGLSPDDLTLFDLVIDTGKVDPDAAVRFLAGAANALPGESDGGPTAAALVVDPVMAEAVSDEFERLARLRAPRARRRGNEQVPGGA